jgi:hypothetical protein
MVREFHRILLHSNGALSKETSGRYAATFDITSFIARFPYLKNGKKIRLGLLYFGFDTNVTSHPQSLCIHIDGFNQDNNVCIGSIKSVSDIIDVIDFVSTNAKFNKRLDTPHVVEGEISKNIIQIYFTGDDEDFINWGPSTNKFKAILEISFDKDVYPPN